MNDKSPRDKLISKIASVSNVLITVSRNPGIDQLASALGLAIAINKMGKRAVAVFSGNIPRSINFLHPERTFENNADSLRDFIISLSKDKADRLQCKPEGDFVKVYITPYKTKITPQDLKFEEGDFNVELILAIGVGSREDLDAAVASHGKIFHNAIVGTINYGSTKDVLGTISWRDEGATCYSEMCSSLIDGLSTPDKPLMSDAVSTALLTGVVAATNQFRNTRTTPAIMTLAANLMANGANQQLITSELSDSVEETEKIEDMKPTPMLENNLDVHNDDNIKPPVAPLVSPANAKIVDETIERDRDNLGSSRSEEAVDAAEEQLSRIQPIQPLSTIPTNDSRPNLAPASSNGQSLIQPLGREMPTGAPLNIPSPNKPSLPPVLPPLQSNNSGSVNPMVNPLPNPLPNPPVNQRPDSGMPLPPPPPIPNFGASNSELPPIPPLPTQNSANNNNGNTSLPPLPPLRSNALPNDNAGMPATDFSAVPPMGSFGQPNNTISTSSNSSLPPIPPISTSVNPVAPAAPEPAAPVAHDPTQFVLPS